MRHQGHGHDFSFILSFLQLTILLSSDEMRTKKTCLDKIIREKENKEESGKVRQISCFLKDQDSLLHSYQYNLEETFLDFFNPELPLKGKSQYSLFIAVHQALCLAFP